MKDCAREIFEHRKKHEKEFYKAWDLLNVEQWRKNQATGKMRKDKEFGRRKASRCVKLPTLLKCYERSQS